MGDCGCQLSCKRLDCPVFANWMTCPSIKWYWTHFGLYVSDSYEPPCIPPPMWPPPSSMWATFICAFCANIGVLCEKCSTSEKMHPSLDYVEFDWLCNYIITFFWRDWFMYVYKYLMCTSFLLAPQIRKLQPKCKLICGASTNVLQPHLLHVNFCCFFWNFTFFSEILLFLLQA